MTYYVTTMESPCGPLFCVVDETGAVVRIDFVNGRHPREPQEIVGRMQEEGIEVVEDPARTAELRGQLAEYFTGERREFDLRLAPEGTPFERSVWEELRRIPFGETRSYGQMAEAIGAPKAVRAVARACAQNHVSLAVPCHRVVGKDGDLTGYRWGVPRKRALLAKERAGKA